MSESDILGSWDGMHIEETIGQVQKVTRMESPQYLAMGKMS